MQFNEAFKEIPSLAHIQWDYDTYGELLQYGVSQYRFQKYFERNGYPPSNSLPIELQSLQNEEFCYYMKELKDKMFQKVWSSQNIPCRPGILNLIDYSIQNNHHLAVCSNSNLQPVTNICGTLFGESRMSYPIRIYGGDRKGIKKKPSPDMYLLALHDINNNKDGHNNPLSPKTNDKSVIIPSRCLVIEDSEVGLQAAKSAGMKCIITPSYYTKSEDFTTADLILNNLGDLF